MDQEGEAISDDHMNGPDRRGEERCWEGSCARGREPWTHQLLVSALCRPCRGGLGIHESAPMTRGSGSGGPKAIFPPFRHKPTTQPWAMFISLIRIVRQSMEVVHDGKYMAACVATGE